MIPILLAAALSAPCETYDETFATLRESGTVVIIMGLEYKGCLLPPIPMGRDGSVVH